MPKPVLTDSLFNADDVATAILSEANLQVTNQDLGVTDISSAFVLSTNWNTWQGHRAYKFNGFVFIWMGTYKGSSASNGEVWMTINNSDFYPNVMTVFPTASHAGDTANNISVHTNGEWKISDPFTPANTDQRIIINGFYRLN